MQVYTELTLVCPDPAQSSHASISLVWAVVVRQTRDERERERERQYLLNSRQSNISHHPAPALLPVIRREVWQGLRLSKYESPCVV